MGEKGEERREVLPVLTWWVMANIFNRRSDTSPGVFKDSPKQRADYPISAWPGVLVPPAEGGSVTGLHPGEDTRLDGPRA